MYLKQNENACIDMLMKHFTFRDTFGLLVCECKRREFSEMGGGLFEN